MAQAVDPKDVWYQEVAPRSYYAESDLERTILQNLSRLYKNYYCCGYKQTLEAPPNPNRRRPDLCMVRKDLCEWIIIEVELGKHALTHVLDQITVFKDTSYGKAHAVYLAQRIGPPVTAKALKTMMDSYPPRVLVMSNEENQTWQSNINALGCELCSFQVYHDKDGLALYRFNGQYPIAPVDFCHCKYQSSVTYVVEVLQPPFLDFHSIRDGATLAVNYQGQTSGWTRRNSGARSFLECLSNSPPLDPLSSRYLLSLDASGVFYFSKG